MDTIVYFYKKQGLREPFVEPVGLKRYMLIRVALDIGEEEWFGENLEPVPDPPQAAEEEPGGQRPRKIMRQGTAEDCGRGEEKRRKKTGKELAGNGGMQWNARKKTGKDSAGNGGMQWNARKKTGKDSAGDGGMQWNARKKTGKDSAGESGGKRGFWHGIIKQRNADKKRKAEEERAQRRLLQEREERIRRTEASMEKLAAKIREFAGEDGKLFCVYEDRVRKRLRRGSSCLSDLWRRFFDWKEFADYKGRFWVEQLMEEVRWPCFVILGTAPCMTEVLWEYACRMKKLRWILPEADCTGEFLEFVEDFYLENGLAVEVQTISQAGEFSRLQLRCDNPSNIIDFTGETGILTSGAAEGSIWLDMLSAEEKGRRIRGRNSHITYLSMKEKWKYAQRRCRSPLET